MAVSPPICEFNLPAPDFDLPGTDGRNWTLADVSGPNGTLIMFICNHCPYVQSILDRILRDTKDMLTLGIGVVAISSNDPVRYPQDGFDKMKALALRHRFGFPYLFDETQDVARHYGAACTPDFFGYNKGLKLQYRGRLDASGRKPAGPEVRRELFEAMRLIASTGAGPLEQVASMGCSIKWKDM
jgi:peroxiredoxin